MTGGSHPSGNQKSRVPGYLGRVLHAGVPVGTCFQIIPGVIVTAWHVLHDIGAGHERAEVTLDSLNGDMAAAQATVLRVDPVHDLAVLETTAALSKSVSGRLNTDSIDTDTEVVVIGVAVVDDRDHQYRFLEAPGKWAGGTTRDEHISLGRLESKSVMKGMSGAPVRLRHGDLVIGVVSARYNSGDGWGRDSVWVARIEDLQPLLVDIPGVMPVQVSGRPQPSEVARIPTVTDADARRHDGRDVWIVRERSRPGLRGDAPSRGSIGPVPIEPTSFVTRKHESIEVLNGQSKPSITIIKGMRGSGKSQLAGAYARARTKDRESLVVWARGNSYEQLVSDLARAAVLIDCKRIDDGSVEASLAFREYTENTQSALILIIDDVQLPAHDLSPLLPASGLSHVILTTSRNMYDDLGKVHELGPFDPDEATEYFCLRTGLPDTYKLRQVAYELGYLPIALAAAATTISNSNDTIEEYYETILGGPPSIDFLDEEQALYPLGAVNAIIKPVDDMVAEINSPDVLPFIFALSLLCDAGVPRNIAKNIPVGITSSTGTARSFLNAAAKHTVVTTDVQGDTLLMHQLTMRYLKARMRSESQEIISESLSRALHALEATQPSAAGPWGKRAPASLHVEQIESLWHGSVDILNAPLVERFVALRIWGIEHLWQVSDSKRALEIAGAAKSAVKEWLPHDGDAIARIDSLVGGVQTSTGSFSLAVENLDRAIRYYLDTYGPDDHRALDTMALRAGAKRALGDGRGALREFGNVVRRSRITRGVDHIETMRATSDLAGILESLGHVTQAIDLFRSNLHSRTRVLGPDHAHTLSAQKHLTGAFETSGDLAAAISGFEQVLENRVRILGEFHPHALISNNDLAHANIAKGNLAVALDLCRSGLIHRNRMLGETHPETISGAIDLGDCLLGFQELDESIKLLKWAYEMSNHLLGRLAPTTLLGASYLARAYRLAGVDAEAYRLFRMVTIQRRDRLGAKHPDTLISVIDSGITAMRSGDVEIGRKSFAQSSKLLVRLLGADHVLPRSITEAADSLASDTQVAFTDEFLLECNRVLRWRPGRRAVKRPA